MECTTDLNSHWQLFPSADVKTTDEAVSTGQFKHPDPCQIQLPSTVMSGLIQNQQYPNVYYGGALEKIDKTQFNQPWWYRKSFHLNRNSTHPYCTLVFEGINYKADIWFNGHLLASEQKTEGPFGIWKLDASDYIRAGENILAVKVSPPKWGDLTIGFVDWSPEAPDKNMGLWRGVKLIQTGALSLHDPFVYSTVDTQTLQKAKIHVNTRIKNHSSQNQRATLSVAFDNVTVSQDITLKAKEEREVVFDPSNFSALNLHNPKLWWPVNMGHPHLYQISLSVRINENISDQQKFSFGIRQIEQYRNDDDHLGFKINGKKFLVKGAGWVDDMLLSDSDQKVKTQVEYVKHMNLNLIRLEGFWGKNKTLYECCDQNGILLMIGWSCQWEWEYYSGRPQDDFMAIRTPEDQEKQANAYTDQVKWLRNHPSVLLWNFGSDKLPEPSLEKLLHDKMSKADPTRPLLSHCAQFESTFSGTSGVKMRGPYDWVSPNYWYIDKKYGGAFGFNTETGPGPQIPTLPSLKKMIPSEHLWPRGEMWNYHSGRFEFNDIERFLKAFHARYGEEESLERFVFKNQISNYEAMRPMFEAFAVNRYHSTGVVQWMLNSAWPKIIWQLYDYFLVPNGAYYGAKKACQPLNLIYHYGNRSIYINNELLHEAADLHMEAKVYDIDSACLLHEKTDIQAPANHAEKILELPYIAGISTTYFLDLRLWDSQGNLISTNFYWLSTKEETHDWEATTWLYTPGIGYADLRGINQMPQVALQASYNLIKNGDHTLLEVVLKNPSKHIAFFTELRLADPKTQDTLTPVFWDDNYLSLLPGESRKVKVQWQSMLTHSMILEIQGWNTGLISMLINL